jgi:hypothetical protein
MKVYVVPQITCFELRIEENIAQQPGCHLTSNGACPGGKTCYITPGS